MNRDQKKMMMSMWLCFMAAAVVMAEGAGDNLAEKCGQVVQKVIPCLGFATGKEATPNKQCCDSATMIKDTDPECLCYIIQQTHKGSPESKSMGIREEQLLQLPSACHVKNASISNCPKLLGLSPSSPDAAIFTNASKTTPAGSAGTETATPQSPNGSVVRAPPIITEVMVMVLAIVLVAFPTRYT